MSEPRTVVLKLPWPPRELSPNFRTKHWSTRWRAASTYKLEGYAEGKKALAKLKWWALEGPVTVDATFYAPDRRRRDTDNLLASIKNGIDGIVSSGLLPDDRAEVLQWGAISLQVAKEAGVLLTLREARPV